MRALLPALVAAAAAGCAIHPQTLSFTELADFAQDKHWRVTIDQEPVSGAVGLYEAMARALKYNLDHHVELMEISLRQRQLDLAHYSLLPNVVSNTGFTERNNYSGGRSVTLLGDRQLGDTSLRASTSTELEVGNSDLTLSWHILDFGLSYVRARQAADRVLIADETKRKVINRILEDVRSAYWKAVSAQRLSAQLRRLNTRVEQALADSRDLSEQSETSPMTALTYERELVEIRREIHELLSELTVAKTQLAALINIKPGTRFWVRVPHDHRQPRLLDMSPEEMVETALVSRSELREVAYKTRINAKEARAAILEMLPGVSADLAPNWNSNDFLFNQHWVTWGAKASWNLLKVFNYPARRAEIEAKDDLLDARALAVTMAIMTQVHVSRVRLIHARRKYRVAQEYHDVQYRILDQIRTALDAGKVSEQTAIREEMNTLVSRVKLDLAFVELQNAFANVHASIGLDPYDGYYVEDETVRGLAAQLKTHWQQLGDRSAS